jgi:3-hydroxyisobutyrate dehydrogenase-like beta-hydroxyacid dehydrogenase
MTARSPGPRGWWKRACSVADTAALCAVADGPHGIVAGLRHGSVYIDLSTVNPAVIRELAPKVDGAGCTILDTPVSGSVATLQQGQLSFMVGGNGQGAQMKLVTNLRVAVQTLAFSESVLLAERGGIPRDRAVEVLLRSAIASPMLAYRAPMLVRPPQQVLFNVRMMLEDVDLALEAASAVRTSLPTALARRVVAAAKALGYAHQEFSAMFNVLSHEPTSYAW